MAGRKRRSRKPSEVRSRKARHRIVGANKLKYLRYAASTGQVIAMSSGDLVNGVYEALMNFLTEARIPWDCALKSLELASAEITDKLAEESLSWVESMHPCHDGTRGRSDDG